MSAKRTHTRRRFIYSILATGAVTGLISQVNTNSKPPVGNKIKMLTADGKLVEVDQSVIDNAMGLKKASGKEVFEWMDKKHKA